MGSTGPAKAAEELASVQLVSTSPDSRRGPRAGGDGSPPARAPHGRWSPATRSSTPRLRACSLAFAIRHRGHDADLECSVAESPLSLAATSKPSMPGIMTSRRIRLGWLLRHCGERCCAAGRGLADKALPGEHDAQQLPVVAFIVHDQKAYWSAVMLAGGGGGTSLCTFPRYRLRGSSSHSGRANRKLSVEPQRRHHRRSRAELVRALSYVPVHKTELCPELAPAPSFLGTST